jgi:hypothetical protein
MLQLNSRKEMGPCCAYGVISFLLQMTATVVRMSFPYIDPKLLIVVRLCSFSSELAGK